MPGFSRSSQWLPDYSARAHARYVSSWLKGLDVERFHLVAYGRGGAVALHLLDIMADGKEDPTCDSLGLIATGGVAELDLLGNAILNRSLYALLNGFAWVLQETLPHFGLMDGALFNRAYTRNLYETDMRPMRGLLEQIRCPTLIIHGRDDALVLPIVAREHRRIVPQSELAWLDSGHLLLMQEPERCADILKDFLQRVARGQVPSRAGAVEERLVAAAEPFAAQPWARMPAKGLSLVIIVVFIIVGTLVSEDLACLTAGILAAKGVLTLPFAFGACFTGILLGDLLLYGLGHHFGHRLLRCRPFRWFISEEMVTRSEQWFKRRGFSLIFATRFIPGTRAATYFAAGVVRAHFAWFLLYFSVSVTVWVTLIVMLTLLFGQPLVDFFAAYHNYVLPGAVGAIVLFYGIWRIVMPLGHFRGRRLLLSRWRRLTRWEYWPWWLIHVPTAVYIFWLGLRCRCLTFFTVVNPAMPASGVIGERKSAILRDLIKAGAPVARWALIPCKTPLEKQWAHVEAFCQKHQLDYPLVFKPDEGQRGLGVAIVHSAAAECTIATPKPRCPSSGLKTKG